MKKQVDQEQNTQHYAGNRCPAHGCPLPGSISDSTLGGGTWYCRFHFHQSPREFDAITLEMRGKMSRGEPLDDVGETQTVADMKTRVRRSVGGVPRAGALLAAKFAQ